MIILEFAIKVLFAVGFLLVALICGLFVFLAWVLQADGRG